MNAFFMEGHHQLLAVTTQGWDERRGELVLYERESDDVPWTVVGVPLAVVVGENGLAWGIGLYPFRLKRNHKQTD